MYVIFHCKLIKLTFYFAVIVLSGFINTYLFSDNLQNKYLQKTYTASNVGLGNIIGVAHNDFTSEVYNPSLYRLFNYKLSAGGHIGFNFFEHWGLLAIPSSYGNWIVDYRSVHSHQDPLFSNILEVGLSYVYIFSPYLSFGLKGKFFLENQKKIDVSIEPSLHYQHIFSSLFKLENGFGLNALYISGGFRDLFFKKNAYYAQAFYSTLGIRFFENKNSYFNLYYENEIFNYLRSFNFKVGLQYYYQIFSIQLGYNYILNYFILHQMTTGVSLYLLKKYFNLAVHYSLEVNFPKNVGQLNSSNVNHYVSLTTTFNVKDDKKPIISFKLNKYKLSFNKLSNYDYINFKFYIRDASPIKKVRFIIKNMDNQVVNEDVYKKIDHYDMSFLYYVRKFNQPKEYEFFPREIKWFGTKKHLPYPLNKEKQKLGAESNSFVESGTYYAFLEVEDIHGNTKTIKSKAIIVNNSYIQDNHFSNIKFTPPDTSQPLQIKIKHQITTFTPNEDTFKEEQIFKIKLKYKKKNSVELESSINRYDLYIWEHISNNQVKIFKHITSNMSPPKKIYWNGIGNALTKVDSNTIYYYKIYVQDTSGNIFKSNVNFFTTGFLFIPQKYGYYVNIPNIEYTNKKSQQFYTKVLNSFLSNLYYYKKYHINLVTHVNIYQNELKNLQYSEEVVLKLKEQLLLKGFLEKKVSIQGFGNIESKRATKWSLYNKKKNSRIEIFLSY